MLTSSSLRRL